MNEITQIHESVEQRIASLKSVLEHENLFKGLRDESVSMITERIHTAIKHNAKSYENMPRLVKDLKASLDVVNSCPRSHLRTVLMEHMFADLPTPYHRAKRDRYQGGNQQQSHCRFHNRDHRLSPPVVLYLLLRHEPTRRHQYK